MPREVQRRPAGRIVRNRRDKQISVAETHLPVANGIPAAVGDTQAGCVAHGVPLSDTTNSSVPRAPAKDATANLRRHGSQRPVPTAITVMDKPMGSN